MFYHIVWFGVDSSDLFIGIIRQNLIAITDPRSRCYIVHAHLKKKLWRGNWKR